MLKMRHAAAVPVRTSDATVSSEYLRVLAMGAEGRGLDARPIFTSAGIDCAVLDERGARVGMGAVNRVWHGLSTHLEDPIFGLKLVETLPFGAADFMDYLVRSSADVGTAIEKVARYAPLMSDAEKLTTVVLSDREVSLRFLTENVTPQPVEMIMGLFARRARDLFGPSWALKRVSFAHAPLGPKEVYERICQAPVRFAMPFTEAVFDRTLLAVPMVGADAHLNGILTAQAEGLLATLAQSTAPRSFLETVEQALSNGLGIGDFTMVGLADHLGLSPRTLQRRLRAEGLTHRGLVRKLRQDLAMKFLSGAITQKQLARSLGYSGVGAFQRAFKGWSGMTPSEIRRDGKRAR